MASIWIVSEDPALAAAVEPALRALGSTACGPPERSAWERAREPDLIVLVGEEREVGKLEAVERMLAFLARIRRYRRPPAPVLYVEPPGGQPPGALVEELIDERPCASLSWPPDPEQIRAAALDLIHRSARPPSLRDRTRSDWVRRRVDLLYAGLDLPELRRAIDPRSSARPILLVGEPGTRRGLLARYIHQLAEPARLRFARLSAASLGAGELEREVLGRSAATHTTVYVHRVDRAVPAALEELADLLTGSGGIALEPLRWIVSADRASALPWSLRLAPWIRVDLPPLRAREDLAELARGLLRELAHAAGREVALGAEALELLERHPWPHNLSELEAVLQLSLESAAGPVLGVEDLRLDLGASPPLGPSGIIPSARPAPEPRPARVPVEEASERSRAPEPADARGQPGAAPASAAPSAGAAQEEEGPKGSPNLALGAVLVPVVEDVRASLLALRTYAALSTQRPDDEGVRRRLASLFDEDVRRIETTLERVRRFAAFGPAQLGSVDVAALLASALERRRPEVRERELVVLEELDRGAPPARADEEQLRFAIEALLDRVLRMVPRAGDLYVGHRFLAKSDDQPARHRVLLRFHSPEEVLAPPTEAGSGGVPVEVTLARVLVETMGGRLSVDVSGPHDNLVLIELRH